MLPASPGFWESLLRPIPSNTAVTPTIAIIKLVTPLSLVLAAVAPYPGVAQAFFYLGAAPVVIALLQVVGLSIFATGELKSEPHREAMAKIQRGYINQNNPDGSQSQVARTSTRLLDNPQMGSEATPVINAPEGEGK